MPEIGNPAPLGLLSFGVTTALLVYVDMGWAEPEFKALVYGYALWYGGIAQFLVGMIEIIKGNLFGATAFSSYGCFWAGMATHYIKSEAGVVDLGAAFKVGEVFWLVTFGLLTFCFWILTFRKNTCLAVTFGLAMTTFFLLAGGVHSLAARRVGGYVGFATALSACYTAFAELFANEWGYHVLPGLRPLWIADTRITQQGIEDRITYEQKSNTLLVDFHNLDVASQEDISIVRGALSAKARSAGQKVDVIANYHGFLIATPLVSEYMSMVKGIQDEFYSSVRRYHTDAFGNGVEAFKGLYANMDAFANHGEASVDCGLKHRADEASREAPGSQEVDVAAGICIEAPKGRDEGVSAGLGDEHPASKAPEKKDDERKGDERENANDGWQHDVDESGKRSAGSEGPDRPAVDAEDEVEAHFSV